MGRPAFLSTLRAAAGVLPVAIVLSSTLLATLPAGAARPLATDDAGVLARGDCEVEIYGVKLNVPDSGASRSASAQLGCGLGGRLMVAASGGRSNQSDADDGQRSDQMQITAKLRLFETAGGNAFALSAGSAAGRIGSAPFQFDSVFVTGIWTGALADRITGHANLGWARRRSTSLDATTWNVALEYALKEGLDIGIEWYGDDRVSPWLGAGLRHAVNDRVVLGASYAVQSASLHQRLISIGATFSF